MHYGFVFTVAVENEHENHLHCNERMSHRIDDCAALDMLLKLITVQRYNQTHTENSSPLHQVQLDTDATAIPHILYRSVVCATSPGLVI